LYCGTNATQAQAVYDQYASLGSSLRTTLLWLNRGKVMRTSDI